jgi:hypothetical protein
MELNPNHKVVRQAHDNWHKIAALILVKLGLTELQLTMEDVDKISHGNVNIVLDARREQGGAKVSPCGSWTTRPQRPWPARKAGGRVIAKWKSSK